MKGKPEPARRAGKTWTDEENEFLIENNGTVSIRKSAQILGRSSRAVIHHRLMLGLGAYLDNGDYITVNQLFRVIYGRNKEDLKWKRWLENDFPVIKKKVINCSFDAVRIADFWKWAEKHQDLISFKDFERGILGKEPEWLDEKKKLDCKKHTRKAWTKYEDSDLRMMVKSGRYNTHQIATILNRSYCSVDARIRTLGLDKSRVPRKEPVIIDDATTKKIDDLIVSGYTYQRVGEELGLDECTVVWKIVAQYGTRNIKEVRRILSESN